MLYNTEYNQQIINIIKSHPKSWSKLKNILEKFDEKLSEAQNMAKYGK